MFFLTLTNAKNIPNYIKQLKLMSRHAIILYPKRATELELDKYIQRKYHTNLTLLCLRIWRNAKFNYTRDNEVVITIPNKELENAAALITFGTGKIRGSNILKAAFSHYERSN